MIPRADHGENGQKRGVLVMEESRAVVRATNVGKSKHQPMTARDEPFII
jgi:hypothetical protein